MSRCRDAITSAYFAKQVTLGAGGWGGGSGEENSFVACCELCRIISFISVMTHIGGGGEFLVYLTHNVAIAVLQMLHVSCPVRVSR